MQEIYFRLHVHKQDEKDDSIIKFNVPDNISEKAFANELNQIISRYSYDEDGYNCVYEMIDDILDTVAKSIGGLWSYYTTIE